MYGKEDFVCNIFANILLNFAREVYSCSDDLDLVVVYMYVMLILKPSIQPFSNANWRILPMFLKKFTAFAHLRNSR